MSNKSKDNNPMKVVSNDCRKNVEIFLSKVKLKYRTV